MKTAGPEERLIGRIRRTAVVLGISGAFLSGLSRGPFAAASFAAAALVVIASFLVLERATARLMSPKIGLSGRDFLVPGIAGLTLLPLLALLLSWRKFDIVCGLFGFSVVVAAIAVELTLGRGRG